MLLLVHGNSFTATKLQTERNIEISGDIKGYAKFDGTKDIIIDTTQDNIVIITGQLLHREATINYPTGFNKDNCIIMSAMFQHPTSEAGSWGEGSLFNSSSFIGGSLPHKIHLNKENIQVQVSNIMFIDGEPVRVLDTDIVHNYKIILLKCDKLKTINAPVLSTGGTNNP